MKNHLKFQEKLSGILSVAQENYNRIDAEDVERYFEDDHLSKEQIELVYDYLLSQKIVVLGYEKKGGIVKGTKTGQDELSQEENRYLAEYQAELSVVKKLSQSEWKKTIEAAVQGDALAKSKAIEQYLPRVLDIARQMHRKGIFLGDMVQEGNVSLVIAMDMLEDPDTADERIEEEVRGGIQAMIEEQEDLKQRDHRMVDKVNRLHEGIEELTNELGRKATIEEAAKFLDMEEDEINGILRIVGEGPEEGEDYEEEDD